MADRNAELVRHYFAQCVNGAGGPDGLRALALVDELMTDDFAMRYNNETDAEAVRGREAHKEFLARHARTFPDDEWTIEALASGGDTVACHWRIQATYVETGNRIDVHAADVYRVRDGRLAELWRFLDFKSFEKQLRRRRAPAAAPDEPR